MRKRYFTTLQVLLSLGLLGTISSFWFLKPEKEVAEKLDVEVIANEPKVEKSPYNHHKFFEQNCFKCHDEDVQKGDMRLDNVTWNFEGKNLKLWEKIYKAVDSGQMPPKKQPEESSKDEFLLQLRSKLAEIELVSVKSNGRSTWRRLTRQEYENTLKDLFDLPHLDVARFLPQDGDIHGFNKMTDALDFSAVHWKSYMEAADAVLKETVLPADKPNAKKASAQFVNRARIPEYNQFKTQGKSSWIFTNGFSGHQVRSAMLDYKVSTPGLYKIKFQAKTVQKKEAHILRVFSEGKSIEQSDVSELKYIDVLPDKWQTFEMEGWLEEGALICFTVPENKHKRSGHTIWTQPGIAVKEVTVDGPYFDEWPLKRHRIVWGKLQGTKTKGRRPVTKIINPGNGRKIVEEQLSSFLPKLFRRPVSSKEKNLYIKIYDERIKAGEPFQNALMAAFKGALCSPAFLFKQINKGSLDQIHLASRLSYFLWNSAPDNQLVSLASSGKLEGEILENEVARLLNSSKSKRFINDFNEQWLNLDELFITSPDTRLYPDVMPVLFDFMKMETNAFLKYMIDNDLSVLNIIDSDFAMLNSRLARHYNVKGVQGSDIRPVKLTSDSKRGGLITQGSILKVTANGTVTSPITRGVWFLENILGTPPPPPPSAVPAFEPEASGMKQTLKEGLAEHRTNTACAGCHKKIDPTGFAFENFDPVGGYRDRYRIYYRNRYKDGRKVDAADQFEGNKFSGMEEFKKVILKDKKQVVRNFIDKLVTYGTGEPLGYSDDQEVEKIIAAAEKKNFGTKSLIQAIVNSNLFTRK